MFLLPLLRPVFPRSYNCCYKITVFSISNTWKRQHTTSNESKIKDNIYTIPNLLCGVRIALSPAISYYIISGQHPVALGLFVIAGITDMLDGQIARRYASQRSLLGSIIDPIADKTLMALTSTSLWYSGLMPWWLYSMIIGKDILLILGGLYLRYRSLEHVSIRNLLNVSDGTVEVKPGLHGKVNMCLQLGAVVFVYDSAYVLLPGPHPFDILHGDDKLFRDLLSLPVFYFIQNYRNNKPKGQTGLDEMRNSSKIDL